MRIAYLDCFSGISGDMFIGALADAGVSPELLKETVRKLDLGAELQITRVDRNGITATRVDVLVDGVRDFPRDLREEQSHSHADAHMHEHSHVHSHEHTHADGTTHTHEHRHTHAHPHQHDDSAHEHVHEHALPRDPEHDYHDEPQVHAHDDRIPGRAAAVASVTAVPDVHEHPHSHSHSHEHSHPDGATHTHEHAHTHIHTHGHDDSTHTQGHERTVMAVVDHAYHSTPEVHAHTDWDGSAHEHKHRGLKEIRAIIGRAEISPRAKERALAIFQTLGEAEAKIHNKGIEAIHFHEVGAVDAIVDIVCAAVASESLGIDQWVCSPLNIGGGVVQCAHGTLPVPAPATLELLKHAPVYSSGIQKELVTPTGAAIVRSLVGEFSDFPAMKISSVGYGAGARNLRGSANVVRVTIGESAQSASAPDQDTIKIIEANLDDMNPQVFGYVIDRLLSEGALDAFGTPVQMKKGRPGMLLSVLARAEDEERIAEVIFAETTTIGLRIREESRQTLRREWVPVSTPWGDVRVKIAHLGETITNYAPEFEDCRRIASEHNVPLKSVMQEAVRMYLQGKQ